MRLSLGLRAADRQELVSEKRPVRIGVTGHRTHRLPALVLPALQRTAADLCEALAAPGSVEIWSPLADGADQIVAAAALAAGLPLVAPLPFPIAEYRADFTNPADRTGFDEQIAASQRIIALPGQHETPESRDAAYADLGAFLVRETEGLIAIWDGAPARGPGGTAEVVARARELDRPLLVITPGEVSKLHVSGPDLDVFARVVTNFGAGVS